MTCLTGAELLKPAARRYRTVKIPGGDVRIQSLTAGEMRALRESLIDKKGELIKRRGDRLQYLLITSTVVDDAGNKQFSDADAMGPDFDNLDGATVSTLVQAIKEWTGFGADADFSAIEDAAKNSESDRQS